MNERRAYHAVALTPPTSVRAAPAEVIAVPAAAPPVPRLPQAPQGPRRRSLVSGLVRTARPRQWLKNVLVFAAPGAAGVLTDPSALGRSSLAFAVFCLAASGTYFFNDTADREHDRRHPVKRHRPVAAGDVSVAAAVATGAVLSGLALAVALAFLGVEVGLVVALYVAVNIAYNLRLRREPVLDLAAVASGFVLRAIAGGLATGVHLSEWFLVVISFASLFVVAGKRQAAAESDDGATETAGPDPAVRIAYPPAFLRYVRLLASGVALTAYCLWALEKAALAHGGLWFELTIVPFALAILRYALMVEQGGERSPEDLLLGDGTMLFLIGAWTGLFAIGVYAV